MNKKISKILIFLSSLILFSCDKTCDPDTGCVSSHDPCPPLCHTEGYFSWHDPQAWILTEDLKEQGVSEFSIDSDPVLREGFLYVRFEVECSDLSVFSFPNISFDQTYHSNYDSKKVENFAKEKSIDFHQSISSDKRNSWVGVGIIASFQQRMATYPPKNIKEILPMPSE